MLTRSVMASLGHNELNLITVQGNNAISFLKLYKCSSNGQFYLWQTCPLIVIVLLAVNSMGHDIIDCCSRIMTSNVIDELSAFPQKMHAVGSYRKISNIRCTLGNKIVDHALRCSWSIACWRCSNYIFILDLTSGFKGFGKDSRKTLRESFKG